jgi:hypothetical protein
LTLFVVPAGLSRENVRLDIPGAASVTLGLRVPGDVAHYSGMMSPSVPR